MAEVLLDAPERVESAVRDRLQSTVAPWRRSWVTFYADSWDERKLKDFNFLAETSEFLQPR